VNNPPAVHLTQRRGIILVGGNEMDYPSRE
jgi:hypothetical protein